MHGCAGQGTAANRCATTVQSAASPRKLGQLIQVLLLQVHLVRGHFEYMSPYSRLPFSDSMEELAVSQAQLRTSPLTSVHMASW